MVKNDAMERGLNKNIINLLIFFHIISIVSISYKIKFWKVPQTERGRVEKYMELQQQGGKQTGMISIFVLFLSILRTMML